MIRLVELAKLSQSQEALTAAYRGGLVLQERGWLRFPAACWDQPAIVAMAGDQCVGVLNYREVEDELYVSVDYAFAEPGHPVALATMLARFRSKYRGSRFESIRFGCHAGNAPMAKAVAALGLKPVFSSYTMPIERLGRSVVGRPAPSSAGIGRIIDWLTRRSWSTSTS